MNVFYDINAPKRPTNLSLNSDLVQKAKAERINLSLVVETALAEQLRITIERNWKEENKAAIRAYNKKIEEIGLFGDGVRPL